MAIFTIISRCSTGCGDNIGYMNNAFFILTLRMEITGHVRDVKEYINKILV